jgi:hypothetical protein
MTLQLGGLFNAFLSDVTFLNSDFQYGYALDGSCLAGY